MQFQWAVLTIEEAKVLKKHIEESTATKGLSINYDKMQKANILEMYNKLKEFIYNSVQYQRLLEFDAERFPYG